MTYFMVVSRLDYPLYELELMPSAKARLRPVTHTQQAPR